MVKAPIEPGMVRSLPGGLSTHSHHRSKVSLTILLPPKKAGDTAGFQICLIIYACEEIRLAMAVTSASRSESSARKRRRRSSNPRVARADRRTVPASSQAAVQLAKPVATTKPGQAIAHLLEPSA